MLKVGQELKGKYRIAGKIGKGGMSTVYIANDMEMARKVWAVKEVKRTARDAAGRDIEQSLMAETDLLARLDHPSIVDIVDTMKTDEYIYIVMDYVDGRPLDKVIREEGPQSEEDVQNWMLQVCDALQYLHSQNPPIIYRDMKPNNIMLRDDGYIKLIDMGVAREYKGSLSKDTTQFGTEGYAPPEQYGRAETDARSDIYALGATMWHLLTGEAPCEMPLPNARTRNPNIGEGFADVIIPRCTQLNREDRYQDCNELAADISIYRELTKEYRDRQKNKVRAFAGTLGAAVLLAVLGLGCLGVQNTLDQNTYDSYIKSAKVSNYEASAHQDAAHKSDVSAGTYSDAADYYEAAISTKPGEVEPYKGLIEVMTSDNNLDDNEYEELTQLIITNQASLETASGWGDLNYQMGKAIWYNYKVGSSSTTDLLNTEAVRASMPYFKIAKDEASSGDRSTAEMYYNIADFVTNIGGKMNTGDDDSAMYKDYWENLKSLMELAKNETNSVVKLNAYALVENAVENYSKQFYKAGVPSSEVSSLLGQASSGLAELEFSDSRRNEQKAQIQGRISTASTRFSTAYNDSSVGNK